MPREPHQPQAVAAPGRGTTRIEGRVVARIAARLAGDALAADVGPGQRGQAPHARTTTAGGAVRVALEVHLPYPADLSGVCTRLQDHVAVHLAEMTGLHVPEVRVGIQHFLIDPGGTPRGPAVDLTKPPARPGSYGPALAEIDGAAAHHAARVPYRWWAARRIPAALTAVLVMAGSGLLLYDIVAAGRGRPSDWAQGPWVRQLTDRPLGSAWTIFAAGLCAMLGLWLVVLALTPGRRRLLPLRPQDQGQVSRAALDRASAAVAMRDAALSVPGVTGARVRLRRRITVRAVSGFGDPQQIDTDLNHAMDHALDGLCLAHPPALTLRIRRRRSWPAEPSPTAT
ncbi:DUF6286 domain-containing Asp23/Gls24 family envelope stress response protein [Streptomyces sp. PvR034]|uniref:DUF6286 domain-containing Asp23/Gls24 family envelope stress response protein n=1 Tax=Streptomyces sp. PvR034 TaxID=3156401 RepID=UPI0033952F58